MRNDLLAAALCMAAATAVCLYFAVNGSCSGPRLADAPAAARPTLSDDAIADLVETMPPPAAARPRADAVVRVKLPPPPCPEGTTSRPTHIGRDETEEPKMAF